MTNDEFRSPSLATCCAAIAASPLGFLRPRRMDRDFLAGLPDAGMPKSRQRVRVRALRQVPKSVPTAGLVEGVRAPRRAPLAMTSFVVAHPRARFVVDPGICAGVRSRVLASLPAVLRVVVAPPRDVVTTKEALADLTEDADVDFALPTHLHWDHVCGLLDLPSLGLRAHRREVEWILEGTTAPVGGVRQALHGRRIEQFDLDGPPIAAFERSHDLFGDGSVILVDLAGHTPGSIGVLLHTGNGWVLLAGDAAWHTSGIDLVRQKPSYPGVLVDDDRDLCFETLHRLHAVRHQMRVVPTHDHRAASALID